MSGAENPVENPVHADTGRRELSETSRRAQEKHAEVLRQYEAERRSRSLLVPTDPRDVQLKLREIGDPICYFGELPGDRRDRLRRRLAELSLDEEAGQDLEESVRRAIQEARGLAGSSYPSASGAEEGQEQTFYTEAKPALRQAREEIGQFSVERAKQRLECEREIRHDLPRQRKEDGHAMELYSDLRRMQVHLSEFGDMRPLSDCAFAPSGRQIASASWHGLAKLWNAQTAEVDAILRGHEERVTGLAFHPQSGVDLSPTACNLITGGADGMVYLWGVEAPAADGNDTNMDDDIALATGEVPSLTPLAGLRGHAARLSKCAFHPMGRFAGTTSFDHTWRLWDVETQQEVLLQEGHSREVYGIAFHPDGALTATGDLGGNGRLWDLRTGKAILDLTGHSKQVLSLDFSPNGIHLASAADDHTIRIWDLRQRRTVYTIPAHSSLISRVRFAPTSGEFLVSSSFDGTIRAWCARDFSPLATLEGHEGKVSCVDVALSEDTLVSCGFDRTVKLWKKDESM